MKATILLFSCLVIATLAEAQNAQLSGLIMDASEAVVPGAEITVLNQDTGVKRTATSNRDGYYAVPALPPGRYKVTAQAGGFQTVSREGIKLEVAEAARLDFKLQVGTVEQTVTVQGGPLVNLESPAVGTVVDRQFVENLPLNGRSFQQLITLTPGVVLAKAPSALSQQGQFSVNGQRPDANYFTVDGVSANIGVSQSGGLFFFGGGTAPGLSVSGGTNTLVSVDALEEFKIQTSTYAPEYGRQPGAQVSIVTRSGNNHFHGALSDYFRNDSLDATDWFANRSRLRKPPMRQNDFGGVLGGPIIKDKTFFFLSYEGLRLRQPQAVTSSTVSLASRQAAGSSLKPFLNAFPLPTGRDLGDGFAELAASYSDPTKLDAGGVRVDHTVKDTLTLFGRYNRAPSEASQRSSIGLSNLNLTEQDTQTFTAGATWGIRPSVIDELRINWSKSRAGNSFILDGLGGAVPPGDSLLFPPFASRDDSLSSLFISPAPVVFNVGQAAKNIERQVNLVDNLTAVRASHQMKVGIDYRRLFPVFGPSKSGLTPIFFSMARFLSGTADLVQQLAFDSPILPLFTNFSAFAQDTWKVTPKLTLTYGLRWEYNPPPSEANGKKPLTVVGLDNPATMTLGPPGSSFWKTTHDSLAPRVGAAYHWSKSANFGRVVRGGFGLFYDVGNSNGAAGFAVYPFGTFTLQFGAPFPLNLASLKPLALPANPLVPPFGRVFASDPNLKLPRTYQWSFSVEQALGTQQTLTASYVAAVGRRLLRGDSVLPSQAKPPNPNFTSLVDVQRSTGTSDYHALQLQFRRHLSKGLQALGSYTWSHSLDNASFNFSFNPPISPTSPDQDRGSSSFDIRHAFAAAITYDIPKARAGSVARVILANWSVDTIITARTATPVNVITGTDTIGTGLAFTTGVSRPDLILAVPLHVADPNVAGGSRFNKAAFNTNLSGRQGTLGRNALRGFGLSQADLALRRRFPLTERASLLFRAEFFNLFNHPNFGDPSGRLNDAFFGQATQMFGKSLGIGQGLGGGLNPLYQVGGPRSTQLALKLQF